MYCTWKNTKCKISKTKISTLKNRPIAEVSIKENNEKLQSQKTKNVFSPTLQEQLKSNFNIQKRQATPWHDKKIHNFTHTQKKPLTDMADFQTILRPAKNLLQKYFHSIVTFMPGPCSHFYFDINFGIRLYSKEKRPGSPLLF